MTRNDLITEVAKLVSGCGKDWKQIAELLNNQGTKAPSGKEWNRDSVRKFYQSVERTRTGKEAKPSAADKRLTQLARRFDDAALDNLEHIIQRWRQGAEIEPETEQKPMFAGKRKNTGIHCNEEILKRAMEKLKTEKKKTGGSLSLLVEWLLWKYIGAPEDILET